MSKQLTFVGDTSEIFGRKSVRKRTTANTTPKAPKTFDCSTCGLDKLCKKPKIRRFGDGKRGILVVGLCPGRDEDRLGIPLIGRSGDFAKESFNLVGLDLDKDCIRTNLISCYPGKDKTGRDRKPTEDQIKCCESRLFNDISEVKPKMIICLGTEAIQSILKTSAISQVNVTKLHGRVFPYHKLNCWVGCLFHPSYFLHKRKGGIKTVDEKWASKDGVDDGLIFTYDLANITGFLDKPLPKPLSMIDNKWVTDVDEALSIFKKFSNINNVVSFDYEATSVVPVDDKSRIIMVSITDSADYGYCIPIEMKDKFTLNYIISDDNDRSRIIDALRNFIISNTPKTCQNYYTEELWSRHKLGVSINNFVHDTMVSCHVINGRPHCNSLGFQAFDLAGHEYKDMVNKNNIESSPLNDLVQYSSWDSRYGIAIYHKQNTEIGSDDKLRKFNNLFTRSLKTLANLKARGIRIDIRALDEIEQEFKGKMDKCLNDVKSNRKIQKYGGFNPNAPAQLGKVLYEGYGIKPPALTPVTKVGATDDETLKVVYKSTDNPEVVELLDGLFGYRKYNDVVKKVVEYRRLIGTDGKIHPTFNLHTTPTYRSSATGPNSQNAYKHDPELKKFRRCIIPEPGQVLLEADYKGHEARVIGMASKDATLISETINKVDCHKKWGGELFKKPIIEVKDEEKYGAKNGFFFPTIFGSLSPAIAKYFDMKIPVDHIESVQRKFWREYAGVCQWQKGLIEFYEMNGYIEGMSGFKAHGPLTVYQICNFPISGPAFHILLDSLNKADEHLMNHGFKTSIINEIHDAMILTADVNEVEDIMNVTTEIMLSKHFDWQIVPLDVSWEIGENWYDMGAI